MAAVPPSVVDLRPLSTGELIDRGFTLYRNHFAGLFLLALLSQGGWLLLQVLTKVLHLVPTHEKLTTDPVGAFSALGSYYALAIVMQLVRFCLTVIIILYIADIYLGRVPSITRSFRQFGGKILGASWTWILKYLFILLTLVFPIMVEIGLIVWFAQAPPHGLGFALFIGLGVIMAVVSLIPLLVVAMRLMLAPVALALESLSGWRACVRSSSLVGFDPGLGFFYWGETRLSLLLLPLFVIHVMVSALSSLPVILAQAREIARTGTATGVLYSSDWVIVGSQILTYVAGALILPLYSIAVLLFYYDVRIRKEGFDLEFMAGRLETAA